MDKEFYEKYVSTHTKTLYGENNLVTAKKNFVWWRGYFGKLLPADKHAKILDAGCGMGDFIFWLKDAGYSNVKGVDISAEQIEAGKKCGFTDVYEGDIFEEFSKSIGTYHVIFARDILEHFGKEESVIFCKKAAGSLDSGGSLVIQSVNAENLLWGRLRHGDFTHEQAFTESSITQLLMIAGFSRVTVSPQRPIVHGVMSLLRYVAWRIFELIIRLYLVVETGSSRGIFTQNLIVVATK